MTSEIGTSIIIDRSIITIIDPFEEYVKVLKSCFDFEALKEWCKRDDFTLLFDGMHGAGGPFAKKIFVEELGLPDSCLLRCDPKPDFGECHPDPNLTYAADLIQRMGLDVDGSIKGDSSITLGAANDGDGDRNLIC